MNYSDVHRAVFLSRPNRFIAHCLVDGEEVVAHVKNTGRCKELLLPGVSVWLQHHDNPARKTSWSLIAVQKGERLINMDSQAPNEIAAEAILDGTLALPGWEQPEAVRREVKYGDSRFDICLEKAGKRAFVEVKGVTLERDGAVYFPDAPTERGVKHVWELCTALGEGYGAFILFVIQMENVCFFSPNDETHPAFGEALREAAKEGVGIIAADCFVKPNEVRLKSIVPVKL